MAPDVKTTDAAKNNDDKLPYWTWRLRADAAEKFRTRCWYAHLRWCIDASSPVKRVVDLLALPVSAICLAMYVPQLIGMPMLMILMGFAFFLFVYKSFVAHVAELRLGADIVVGGVPTVPRFDKLIPVDAKKIALVGQNQKSRFDQDYSVTLESLKSLLSRENVKEIWIVIQTPLALWSDHPKAGKHLEDFTLEGLQRLAVDLPNEERVRVAFHPAATLSAIVVDYDEEKPLAIVTPKLQTTAKVKNRFSMVVQGDEYEAIMAGFERFLLEVDEFEGGKTAKLADAATILKELCQDPVLKEVKRHLNVEEE